MQSYIRVLDPLRVHLDPLGVHQAPLRVHQAPLRVHQDPLGVNQHHLVPLHPRQDDGGRPPMAQVEIKPTVKEICLEGYNQTEPQV